MTWRHGDARDERPGTPLSWIAAGVSAVVVALMLLSTRGRLPLTLGDTDDAMRLVIVRGFMSGETGWFNQHLTRLQPPLGLDMHWSRLLDAGIAGLMRLFDVFMPPDRAEAAARLVWPMLWIFPAVWAALSMARRLGGRAALLPAAGFLAANFILYVQWWPGRIDHHDVQITLALAAVAGAMVGGRRAGVLAGAATGLGLAVGLEALPFLALAGAGFALRFLAADLSPPTRLLPLWGSWPRSGLRGTLTPSAAGGLARQDHQSPPQPPLRAAAPPGGEQPDRAEAQAHPPLDEEAAGAGAYATALLAATTVLYLAQTPPGHWTASVCDALAANLWCAVAVAAAGLLAAVTFTRTLPWRLAALAITGAAAAGVYLALDPICIHGPLAAVDPRLKPIWLDVVTEMKPLLAGFWTERSDLVACALIMTVLGALAWLWLGRTQPGRTPAWLIAGAALAMAFATALGAQRMASYANWFAVPLIAAAVGEITARHAKGSLIPALLATALLSQPVLIAALDAIPGWVAPARPDAQTGQGDHCSETPAFARLAGQPAGLVLAEIDLGPRVLANSRHSVVSAPYHRMGWGILAAHDALAAAPGPDEAAVRKLGVAYVLACPAHIAQLNHKGLGPQSLQVRLDVRQPPPWLEPLSPPGEALQVYAVRPAAPALRGWAR